MKKYIFIAICFIASFIISFQRTTPTVLYDELAAFVDQDDTKMGIYGSMFYFASFISFLLSSFLVSKFPLSYLLSIFLLIGGVGSIVLYFAKSFAVLCIARFIIGIGLSPAIVIMILIFRSEHDPLTAYISQNLLFLTDMFGALFTVGPFSSSFPYASS